MSPNPFDGVAPVPWDTPAESVPLASFGRVIDAVSNDGKEEAEIVIKRRRTRRKRGPRRRRAGGD